MEKAKLVHFLRNNLDLLFVGLNPAKGSNDNGHYFSVKQTFWNQLYESGLINIPVDKKLADDIIFGSNQSNYNKCQFGITDLVTQFAESNSSKIKPTEQDISRLINEIKKFNPRFVVILHGTVLVTFYAYLKLKTPKSNTGYLGTLIVNCETVFYNIAFPHGNSIPSSEKVKHYKELKSKI